MYTERTRDDILADMLELVRDDVDKREGSVVHDMLAPPAEEHELLGFELEAILENGFMDTAQAEYIDKRANELGVYRKVAEYAKGEVLIAGNPDTAVEIGTKIVVQTDDVSVTLETTEYAVIGDAGEVSVKAIASEPGAYGNIGTDVELTSEDFEYEALLLEQPLIGGIDEEPDFELKERYLLKVRKPITSGNIYHYELWAREVEGISQARVIPLWDGNGTVKVIVVNMEGRAPIPAKVEEVAAHIESARPIGADVTVVAITEVPVNITVSLTLAGDLTVADVEDDIKASIGAYLAEKVEHIRYSQIASAILDTEGVRDYSGLLIGKSASGLGADNLTVEKDDVAIVGTVVLT